MKLKISAYILSSLFSLLPLYSWAQDGMAREAAENAVSRFAHLSFIQGMSLSVEVGTPIAHLIGGNTLGSEAALRFSIKNKYFPVAELGYAKYNGTNDETNIQYKTAAPYLRLGADINMLKDKTQNNRLFVGGRLAFSTYNFDVNGPDIKDPIWHNAHPLDYEGLSANRLWFELVVGLEAEVFKNYHMGFNVRYKSKLKEKQPIEATPYYVPGFGSGGNSGFTLSYYLTFDLSKKIKAELPTRQ